MQIIIKTYYDNKQEKMRHSAFLVIILSLILFVTGCSKKNDISNQLLSAKDTITKSINSNDSANFVKLSYEQEQGNFLYNKYCNVCHGETGKGNGFNAFNLNPHPRNFTDSIFAANLNVDSIQIVISRGGKSAGKSALMHPYGYTLKSNEIEYLAQYILFLSSLKK